MLLHGQYLPPAVSSSDTQILCLWLVQAGFQECKLFYGARKERSLKPAVSKFLKVATSRTHIRTDCLAVTFLTINCFNKSVALNEEVLVIIHTRRKDSLSLNNQMVNQGPSLDLIFKSTNNFLLINFATDLRFQSSAMFRAYCMRVWFGFMWLRIRSYLCRPLWILGFHKKL